MPARSKVSRSSKLELEMELARMKSGRAASTSSALGFMPEPMLATSSPSSRP